MYFIIPCYTGFVIQFSFGLFFGFWCFHLLQLYLYLAFPFKTKQLLDSSSHKRMIHITEVTIVLLVSVIPPIITLTVSQYESNGYYCFPQSPTVLFYGEILPSMFKLCVGFVLLFLSLKLLRKVSLYACIITFTANDIATTYLIFEFSLKISVMKTNKLKYFPLSVSLIRIYPKIICTCILDCLL